MKKAFLLTLIFVLLGISAHASEEILTYDISDNEVTITGLSVSGVMDLNIPEEIEGYPVTKIQDSAFYGSFLSFVTIPDSVVEIGSEAFSYCSNLRDITLPEHDIKIGRNAFYATGLYEDYLSVPNSTLYIGKHLIDSTNPQCVIEEGTLTIADEAFYNCNELTEIVIPQSVVRIGESAFDCCYDLKSVTIEEGTKYIGNYAFSSCSSLNEITLPDSVIQIGYGTFNGVGYQFEIINSAAYIGNHLIWVEDSLCGTYTIKEGTRSIAGEAFINFDQSGLEKVIFPDSLKGIGEYAFWWCTALKEISIPSSVEYIGGSAFGFCENLVKATIPGTVSYIGNNAFYCCDSLNTVYTLNKKWDYEFEDTVALVDGSSASPFGLETADDMYKLSEAVNGGMNFEDIYFVLKEDISLSNNDWTPIGTYDNPFSGNIDGANHTISDYKITTLAGDYSWDGYTGFFGYTSNASIKNMNLSDFEINIANPDGNTYLGSFAGRTNATNIENCSANGNIILSNTANNAYEADIGGIVAQCDYGSIISTNASCNIYYIGNETTGSGNTQVRLGGIAGYAYSRIENCTSDCYLYGTGLVWRAGGIAGDLSYGGDVCISDCTAKGKIRLVRNDTADAILHCGGIAGFSRELIEDSKSYMDIEICGNKSVSQQLVIDSFSWNGWYCGPIFGVGYTGGNFKSLNNLSYGSVKVSTVPAKPAVQSVNVVYEGDSCEYSVMVESMAEITGKFVIALYCGNALVGVQSCDIDVDNNIIVIEDSVETTKKPDICKVFVWNDFVKLEPLTDMVSIEM